jgi:hypothetical protein
MVVLPGQHAFRSCGAPLAITEDTLTRGLTPEVRIRRLRPTTSGLDQSVK